MKDITPYKINGFKDEEFKQILLDGITPVSYIISSYGRVFSVNYHNIPGKIREIKSHFDKDMYKVVHLSLDGKPHTEKVHRLVGFAFIENPDPTIKTQINHKTGIKFDNHYWNLEWSTNKENQEHALNNGLKNPVKGEDVWCSKFSELEIRKICEMLENNKSIEDISSATGASHNLIHHVLRGKRWRHVTCDYDFSDYHFGKDVEQIKNVCRLLESNLYTQAEISRMTGMDIKIVNNILRGHSHKDISKDFDLSKFTKTRCA